MSGGWGEACVVSIKVAKRASAESGIRHRIDIANFGGDIKLFLWWRVECI